MHLLPRLDGTAFGDARRRAHTLRNFLRAVSSAAMVARSSADINLGEYATAFAASRRRSSWGPSGPLNDGPLSGTLPTSVRLGVERKSAGILRRESAAVAEQIPSHSYDGCDVVVRYESLHHVAGSQNP